MDDTRRPSLRNLVLDEMAQTISCSCTRKIFSLSSQPTLDSIKARLKWDLSLSGMLHRRVGLLGLISCPMGMDVTCSRCGLWRLLAAVTRPWVWWPIENVVDWPTWGKTTSLLRPTSPGRRPRRELGLNPRASFWASKYSFFFSKSSMTFWTFCTAVVESADLSSRIFLICVRTADDEPDHWAALWDEVIPGGAKDLRSPAETLPGPPCSKSGSSGSNFTWNIDLYSVTFCHNCNCTFSFTCFWCPSKWKNVEVFCHYQHRQIYLVRGIQNADIWITISSLYTA